MATFRSLMILLTVVSCLGKIHVSADESLEEIRARLSSLESSHETQWRSLQNLDQRLEYDVQDIQQSCLDMKNSVDEHQEVLDDLQEQVLGQEPGGQGENGGQNLAGPCHPDNYTVIDDERRRIAGKYEGDDHICDRNMNQGWKRFKLNDQNAVIPTACVPEYNCQTHAPTWVDLQGQSLPGVGQQVDARACSHWSSSCCNWEVPITVHNCGDFFVYNVQPTRGCEMAYCAEPQN